jgi:hypothetical protein
MSEEKQESTGGSIKNIIIGLVSTITLGVGGWFTTKLTGGDEAAPVQQAAPVINIISTNTLQSMPTSPSRWVMTMSSAPRLEACVSGEKVCAALSKTALVSASLAAKSADALA